MSLNNLPINSGGDGGDSAEIVEAGDVLSFESPDGTYYLNSDRTVEGTVYPAGTTLLKDGNEFVEITQGTITTNVNNLQNTQTTISNTLTSVQNLQESIREHTMLKVAALITDPVASVEAAYTQYTAAGVTGILAFENIGGSGYILDIGSQSIIRGSTELPLPIGSEISVNNNENLADYRRWSGANWIQISFNVSGPTVTDPAFPGTSTSNPFLPAATLSLAEYDNAHYSLHDISASEWTAVKRSYTDTTVTRIDESSGQTKPTTTAELKTLFGD